MAKANVLQGLIALIETKYKLQVVDSYYVLVDDKYNIYNTMLAVEMSAAMRRNFAQLYGSQHSAMHVAWSEYGDIVRFYAEVGNNILLLLDSLVEKPLHQIVFKKGGEKHANASTDDTARL